MEVDGRINISKHLFKCDISLPSSYRALIFFPVIGRFATSLQAMLTFPLLVTMIQTLLLAIAGRLRVNTASDARQSIPTPEELQGYAKEGREWDYDAMLKAGSMPEKLTSASSALHPTSHVLSGLINHVTCQA